jgi:uncharacterized membrane protein HdeD (DUF308 family)
MRRSKFKRWVEAGAWWIQATRKQLLTYNAEIVMTNNEKGFAAILRGNWIMLLLRGLAAIAFGIVVWLMPGISLTALVMLFGAYSLTDGILGVWVAIAGRKEHDDWWVLLLGGLLGIMVGVFTFLAPGLTAIALLFYIAIWAIATGVLEIVAAIRLRKEIQGEWLLILGGLASVVFGVLLMAHPATGALAVLWMIAFYAIVFGVLLLILSFKARRFEKTVEVTDKSR